MDIEDRIARLERLAGVQEEKAPVVVNSVDELLAQAKDLDPETKVKLVEAMGFVPMGSSHDDDCDSRFGGGIRCNCVPPATTWHGPTDVDVHRKETWDDRLALAHKWSREGSHGREKEDA